MRKFNKREQGIIRKLVNYYQSYQNLSTISLFLSKKVVDDDLKILIREDGNYLLYGKEEKKKENLFTVVEIFNLFRDLIDNHLIALMPAPIKGLLVIDNTQTSMKSGTSDQVIIFQNNDYICRKDNYWYDEKGQLKYVCLLMTEEQFKIKDFIASVPVISPELEYLVKNNFKTTEEKTLRVTQFAAGVSFLAFLAAIILPFVTSTKLNENQHRECIDSIQAVRNEISNSTDKITDAIDSSKYVALNDTCK